MSTVEFRRVAVPCLVASAVTLLFAALLAGDLPASERTWAWLGFAVAAVAGFLAGFGVRALDRRHGAGATGSSRVLLATIVVAVVAGSIFQRVLDARYLMMIEAVAGALFISLVLTNRDR
jgi:fructose-specific phosphotransferase system IIC component